MSWTSADWRRRKVATGTGAIALALTLAGAGHRSVIGSGSVAIVLAPSGAGTGDLAETGDELVLGATALISDSQLGLVNEAVRIVEIERDLLVPGRTRVTLANRKRRLTDLILKSGSAGRGSALNGPGSGGGTVGTPVTPPTTTPPTGGTGSSLPSLALTATLTADVPAVQAAVSATTTSVKIAVSTSGFPSLTTVRAAGAIASPYQATFTALSVGSTLYAAGLAQDQFGQESAIAYTTIARAQPQYTSTGSIAIAPTLSGSESAALPTGVPDLWVWHKRGDFYSDAGSTLQSSNGGSIQQWSDSSGNSHPLTQGTSGQRPTLDTSATHLSVASARLTASSTQWWAWAFSSLPGGSAMEYFIVAKAASGAPANSKILMYASREGSSSLGACFYPDTDGHLKDGTATVGRTDFGAQTLDDDFHVYNYAIDSSSLNAWLSNVSIHSDTTGRTVTFNKIAAGLGANADGPSSTTAFDGWVWELIVYSRVLTSAERAGVYAYLTRA